jgi:hypothetical protein
MLKISTKKFDPANLPEGVWVTYSEGVRFKIRKLTGDALKALRKPFVTTSLEFNLSSRRMEQAEKLDIEKYDDALVEFIIEGFENLGDESGNMLPDSLESRRAIMNIPALREFIWESASTLDLLQQQKQEEKVKN